MMIYIIYIAKPKRTDRQYMSSHISSLDSPLVVGFVHGYRFASYELSSHTRVPGTSPQLCMRSFWPIINRELVRGGAGRSFVSFGRFLMIPRASTTGGWGAIGKSADSYQLGNTVTGKFWAIVQYGGRKVGEEPEWGTNTQKPHRLLRLILLLFFGIKNSCILLFSTYSNNIVNHLSWWE